jgi:hypothetical protein
MLLRKEELLTNFNVPVRKGARKEVFLKNNNYISITY